MKKLIFLVTILISVATHAQNTKVIYTCPMHPEVQRSGPGNCPKCGMTLVKKTIRVAAKPVTKKPPPKTQARTQVKKTPVAQKKQPAPLKTDTIPKKDAAQTKIIYTCPMHPEVQSDKPGKCPKCGMTLVKKEVATGGEHEGHQMEDNVKTFTDPAVDAMVGSNVDLQPGRTVVVHLYVRDTMVNYTGKTRRAIAINGSIPAPTLEFTEGDTAEIWLHNELKEETSLHWHGIILPNWFDGVPYLTTKRIAPGDTYVYKYRIVQNGTYWYHSHSALQEQMGMYGALVLKKRSEGEGIGKGGADKHHTVVLSEWTDDNPMQIQRRLRTANDWFAIKKGSTQSYAEAIKEGHFKTKLVNEWKRMKAMDVSDIFYERFLVNGKQENLMTGVKPGDRVKLHIVNAGASSYFWLTYGGGKITVVGNDGNDVEPVEVDRLIVAVAETYDVIVTVPDNRSFEFRATSEDRTGYSSLWLGSGTKVPAPTLPRLKYFEGMKMMNDMMNTDGSMKDMGMQMSLQKMDMNSVMYPEIIGGKGDADGSGNNPQPKDSTDPHTGHNMQHMSNSGIVTLNYDMLRSPVQTSLPGENIRVLHFSLTGNMNRYLWTLDNKTVTETDRIMINKGEILRLILTNNSMMRHPMHLHGHDFRVVNSQGEYSPLKNVIDVMPMETDTIEFAANQDGNWFFHCHILYHMMAGMGRVFRYNNSVVNPDLPDAEEAYRKFKKHPDQNMRHLMVRAGFESNGTDGEAMYSTNRYALQGIWHLGLSAKHGYEAELNFGRYLGANQWWFPYMGLDYHYQREKAGHGSGKYETNMFGQRSNKTNRKTFVVGVQYTTPWLLLADARVDGDGKFRFQIGREDIPITSRLRLNFMANTDKEYMAGFRYIVLKWLALSTHYDTDMGIGAGLTITY